MNPLYARDRIPENARNKSINGNNSSNGNNTRWLEATPLDGSNPISVSERRGGERWERYFNKGANKSKEEAAVPPRTSRKELKERCGNSGGNSSRSRCLVVPKRRVEEGHAMARNVHTPPPRSRVGNVGRMRRNAGRKTLRHAREPRLSTYDLSPPLSCV